MGVFLDLLGTSRDLFRIGKNKWRVDASAAASLRDLLLGNAEIDFTNPTVNQVLKYNGTKWLPQNESGGGGGGYTEIAASGNITGTYQGNVFGLGDVNITGNVIIRGNLFVTGKLINNGGYSIIVNGDCIIGGVFEFQAPALTEQQNFTVQGDLIVQGEGTAIQNQALVSSGIDEDTIDNLEESINTGGRSVQVVNVNSFGNFDVQDNNGFFSDLTQIVQAGDFIFDAANSETQEIQSVTDLGGGVMNIVLVNPFTNDPTGQNLSLNVRRFFEAFSDDLFGNNIINVGDTVEFLSGPNTAEVRTIADAGYDSSVNTGYYLLDTNLPNNTDSGQNFRVGEDLILRVTNSSTNWGGGDEISIIAGTGSVGNFRQINSTLAGSSNLFVRLVTAFANVNTGDIASRSARDFVILNVNNLNGQAAQFSAGSNNPSFSVTLTYFGPYTGTLYSGEQYQVTPTTTNTILPSDILELTVVTGSLFKSNNVGGIPGNIFVGGSLVTRGIDAVPLVAENAPSLTVLGDIYGRQRTGRPLSETVLDFSALNANSGINNGNDAGDILVNGGIYSCSVKATGGLNRALNGQAGNGGDLTCAEFIGADLIDQNFLPNATADGNSIDLSGGDSNSDNGSGGNTGALTVYGDVVCLSILMIGGDKPDDQGIGSQINGGDVLDFKIQGKLISYISTIIRPGHGTGLTFENGSFAGEYFIGGDANYNKFQFQPGAVFSQASFSNNGAIALTIKGDCRCMNPQLDSEDNSFILIPDSPISPTMSSSNAMFGCSLDIYGSFFSRSLIVGGLSSTLGAISNPNNYNAGEVTIRGNANAREIALTGIEGNGGQVFIGGDWQGGVIAVSGGTRSIASSNGSPAGAITVQGNIVSGANLLAIGGNKTTTSGLGGVGGTILIGGNASGSSGLNINVSGGQGFQASGGAGGVAQIRGDCSGINITANGGNASSTGNNAGGAAGTIEIVGQTSRGVSGNFITATGGNAVGSGGGGLGGNVSILGFAAMQSIVCNGGNSPTGTAGAMGEVRLLGGCQLQTITLNDGTGTAPVTTRSLRLRGACHFNTITSTNRAGFTIRPDDISSAANMPQVILSVSTLTGKTVFNDTVGATGAFVSTNLYYATSGRWYRLAGTLA